MSETKPCDYQPRHDTLKSILEELGKLHGMTQTKPKVFQQLKSDIQKYCGNGYLDAFYRDEGDRGERGQTNTGGSILLLTQAADRIGREILQRPSWTSRFIDPHVSHKGQNCAERISNALKKCLPELFPALFFLFFNVSNDCKGFGGGSWNTLPVNGSDSENSLYQWLIADSSDDFIARGFLQKDLHPSNKGQSLVEELKKAVSLKPDGYTGALQNVLCGFMFVCEWDDPLTGHACLFLSTFCSKVSQGPEDFLKDPYKEHSEAFKEVCSALKSDLQPFINGSSGLSAVCHGNTDLFKDLWDDDKFLQYCEWLKRNLHHIIGALQTMFLESSQWSSDHLMSAASAGPFKYGFVFKASWQASTSKSKLQGCISKLTGEDSGSLQKFISFLENPSTPSSALTTAAGAAGGIFGLGGAGAGAAYGLNLFGFKNLITSFISSFLK